MKNYSLTETFFISQDSAGNPLEFTGGDHALACLAFDNKTQQLVELNLLTASEHWNADQSQALFERLVLLAGVNGGSVPRVLRRGQMDGLLFFTLALEEGEILTDYSRRTGGIPERATLELLDGLLAKLTRLQALPRLFRACSLAGAQLIYSPQGAQYQRVIQIRQLGLHQLEVRTGEDTAEQRLAVELGQLVYQMLTGHISPVRGGPLVESVRLLDRCFLLRQFVANAFFTGGNMPLTFADAATALSSARQFATDSGANALNVPPFSVPWLSQIFGSSQLDYLYPLQFELLSQSSSVIDEISARPARDTKTKEQVFLLPLPGKRILPRPQFSSAPDGLAQIPAEKALHLLFPHSTWNSDHFTFHIEKCRNSFTLREFLQHRGALQSGEIFAILTQVEAAQQEARALGLAIPSVKSSAIRCVFRDDCDESTLAERCRMTVSHWPSHLIKVRIHASLNSVTNPWPAGIDPDRAEETQFNDAFALLAVEMAGGAAGLEQHGHLPAELVKFLKQQAQAAAGREPVLEPVAFLKALGQRGGVMNFISRAAINGEGHPAPQKPEPESPTLNPPPENVQPAVNLEIPEVITAPESDAIAALVSIFAEMPTAPATEISTLPNEQDLSGTAPTLPQEIQPAAEAPAVAAAMPAAPSQPVEPTQPYLNGHSLVVGSPPISHHQPIEPVEAVVNQLITEVKTIELASPIMAMEPEPWEPQINDQMAGEISAVALDSVLIVEAAPSAVDAERQDAPPLCATTMPAALPASSPGAIAAQFKSVALSADQISEMEKASEIVAVAGIPSAETPQVNGAHYPPDSPKAPTEGFKLFRERADSADLEPLISPALPHPIPASNMQIAPFPTEALLQEATAPASTDLAATTAPYEPKSFPPSTTGLVTWRFESTPKPEAVKPAVTTPEPQPAGRAPSVSGISLSAAAWQPEPAPLPTPSITLPPDALAETEHSPAAEEPLEDLPMDDFGAPTLNIDLARLTTSDRLFSSRPRTITIRNR